MNLFSTRPYAFDHPAEVAHAMNLVGRADAVLGVVLRQADQAVLTQQLQDALTSRSVIDQALGILMGQQRCTSTEAFVLWRSASSHRNRKLRDVAAEIIVSITQQFWSVRRQADPTTGLTRTRLWRSPWSASAHFTRTLTRHAMATACTDPGMDSQTGLSGDLARIQVG